MKRSLEIELISAEALTIDRKPVKRNTFCVAKIDQKFKRSRVDEMGGSYAIWKDKIEMEMPTDGSVRFISVEVLYQKSGGQDKNIGYAKIPVTDFIGGFAPQGHLNFLSYRLRDEYGDKSGIVNVSIKVKPDGNDDYTFKTSSSSSVLAPACSYQAVAAGNGQTWGRPKTTYSSMALTTGYSGRVVTGFPVSFDKNNQSSGGKSTSSTW